MLKKLAIIGTNGIPAKYGGFETLAEQLAKDLSVYYEILVYCARTPKKLRRTFNGVRLKYLPFKANGWESILYDAYSIIDAFFTSDILLVLGFSGAIVFPLNLVFRKRIVFNIGGIEWKKVRGSKKFAVIEIFIKKWFEHLCVKFSTVIIGDNKVICDYVTQTYHRDCILVEYGGDHAVSRPIDPALFQKFTFLSQKYDVSISRAQEDMNIHLIIKAYAEVSNRKMVLISNWNSSEYGVNLKKEFLGKYPNIILIDAIYDKDLLNMIRSNCELYIHSHSLCGSAPSLIEAMFLGLPILCYDVDTNRSTTENKSLYFKDSHSLAQLLLLLSSEKLKSIAEDMKEIALRRYYWARVTNIYRTLIG